MKNKEVNKRTVDKLIFDFFSKEKIDETQLKFLLIETNLIFGKGFKKVQNKDKEALIKLQLHSSDYLRILTKKEKDSTNSKELEDYVKEFYTKYKQIYDSTTRQWDILDLAYLSVLRDLLSIDYKGTILDEVSRQGQEIYKRYNSSNQLIVYRYLEILFNISKFQDNQWPKLQLIKTNKESEEVIKSLSVDINEEISQKEDFIDFIEYILFDRRLPIPPIPNEEEYKADNVINNWLINLSKANLFHNTRYTILSKYINNFSSNPIAINKILNVYRHIQNIKFQVVVRDFSDLEFGHYTTGDTLQKLLEQDENKSSKGKYEIKGKTRLYAYIMLVI